ncbi:meiosis-specific protein ASY2-like [Raphanus sativus]|uniref:Meiosis-specific protein ASY2-like n=1 Tax=Raphanus sativus TaxID=3726 RepID=A0A6J0LGT8_RAPSA|nr:meiosis-specific protein ASY2-like [Raphanus sativus]
MTPSPGKYSAHEKGKGVQTADRSPTKPSIAPKLMGSAIRAGRLGRSEAIAPDLGLGCEIERRDLRTIGTEGGVPIRDGAVDGSDDRSIACDPEFGDPCLDRAGSVRGKVESARWNCQCMTQFRLKIDGSIEQLLDLPSENFRPSTVVGCDWEDVLPTLSSFRSVSSLLRGCKAHGVTFMVPRADPRPWSAPVGFHCVYESFFEKDSKLWFPIPRLITSYYLRRGVALTQLMTGAIRIAVALMVMAAEIGVAMSDRIFEELTQAQPRPNGLYAVQMRSCVRILTGHPTRAPKDWQRFYFFVKADGFAFEEIPSDDFRVLWGRDFVGYPTDEGSSDTFWEDLSKIVALGQQEWGHFDHKRIRRQRKRIAKFDWPSNLPCTKTKGKRLKLPMGQVPKAYPSYRDILRAQLDGESFAAVSESGRQGDEVTDPPCVEPGITTNDVAADGLGDASAEVDPSKKKKKKTKHSKRTKIGSGSETELARSIDGCPTDTSHAVLETAQSVGLETSAKRVESSGVKRKRSIDGDSCEVGEKRLEDEDHRSSLTPRAKMPGVAHVMPEVSELALSERFRRSAQADIEAIIRKNKLVLDYELALRKAALDLADAEATIEVKEAEIEKHKEDALNKSRDIVAERSRYYRERKQAEETAAGLEEELEDARAKIARLEAEKSEEAGRIKRTMDRMRQMHRRELVSTKSGIRAVATERFDRFRRYIEEREKLLLHSQAVGSLDMLGLLGEWGMPVPKKLEDISAANEALYKIELEKAVVEEITEHDLVLPTFPGLDSSRGSDPNVDEFGFNVGTVDPADVPTLRASTLNLGVQSDTPSSDTPLETVREAPFGTILTDKQDAVIVDPMEARIVGETNVLASDVTAED